MYYVDRTVRQYTDITAAREPVPGGGSVAAVAGALAAALTTMVGSFTSGNPKYAEHEGRIKEAIAESEALRHQLLDLADQDVEVYSEVTLAYRMPRATAEDKAVRQRAVQEALTHAAAVPLAIAKAAHRVLALAAELVDIGNPNLASDIGVAALLAEAALRGAALNVEINSAAIKDTATVEGLRGYLADTLPEARGACEDVIARVMARIRA